jgi:hypothetical protein
VTTKNKKAPEARVAIRRDFVETYALEVPYGETPSTEQIRDFLIVVERSLPNARVTTFDPPQFYTSNDTGTWTALLVENHEYVQTDLP